MAALVWLVAVALFIGWLLVTHTNRHFWFGVGIGMVILGVGCLTFAALFTVFG